MPRRMGRVSGVFGYVMRQDFILEALYCQTPKVKFGALAFWALFGYNHSAFFDIDLDWKNADENGALFLFKHAQECSQL